MRIVVSIVLVVAAFSCSCEAPKSRPEGTSASGAPKAGLGTVMSDVARRFELAGRAVLANRFELAEFEAGEIRELFETDVPAAELPKEGPTAHIPAMAKAFLATNAPELQKAAASKDRKAFEAAFEHTAAACNGCHAASEKGFIQIPAVVGKVVPDLDLVGPTGSAR
jgi:hypothetical protein